jgi:hypothetical protein
MVQGRGCLFLLKTATLEAKNVPGRCRDEDSMSYLSTVLLVSASRHQKKFFNTFT